MADDGDLMDGDLEDGELSGSCSDTEMGTGAAAPTRPRGPPAFIGHSFRSRAPAQTTAYRGGARAAAAAATASSGSDSSDEEVAVWGKRQKVSHAPLRPAGPTPTSAPGAQGGRKVNNIWGAVVQEQSQDAIAAELDIFGMDGEVSMSSRSVETYNYVLARKMMARDREKHKQADKAGEVSMLDAELEEYTEGKDPETEGGGAKRKRPVKERLGPMAAMDVKGRYEISEDDPEDKVADEIAYRLQEPKKDLIERVLKVIGNKKAIELLRETAALEEGGGVHTVDGSRRRTPGGVYLNLLKNTPGVTRAQVRKIFLDEQHKDQKSKKAAQKRKRHLVAKNMKQAIGTLNLQEHDDVSRETFASDTNEALESLEEAAEGGRDGAGGPDDPAGGPDDAAVVYNCADLEVF
ncbi:phosphorylated adapter RNA export protein [Brachionichthys hirsutus]|uniref:phosphorylated adapter RNA export protein n=1 Tax=Brachionichthys hirsutus TaxID=412623 RepID=UPI003604D7C8